MAKAFLFHNPRCSKSRQALNLLEKEKENFEVFMYLDEKLEKNFLKEIIQKLGISPRDLLRTGESAYKENNLKDSHAGLHSAKKFIRMQLGKELTFYRIPELTFRLDTSLDHGDRINELLTRVSE